MSGARDRELALHWRLLAQARPYWPHLGGLLALSLLAAPLALVTPLPLRIVVDSVIGAHPLPGPLSAWIPDALERSWPGLLALAVALVVVFAVLRQLLELAVLALGVRVRERLVLEQRAQLFRRAQRLSVAHHDARGTTDATYRIQYDVPAAQTVATDGVIPFVTAGVTLIGMVVATTRIDALLGLVALSVSPILLFVSHTYRRRFRAQWRELRDLETSALSVVEEALGAIRVVKAFGQEDREEQRFVRESGHGVGARVRLAAAEGSFALLIGLVTAAGTAAVLFVGVHHVRQGVITLGELLMVMAYLAQLYDPLRTMSKMAANLQAALASAERVFALMDSPPDVLERPHARHLVRAKGLLEFRDVSFAYILGRPILKGASFEIAPGRCLGISGATGAGKTTLVSLLMRFYDPADGAILLDGVDLRDYRLADLRNQFGTVLQEPVLFSTSIAENIAYARPDAGEGAIVEAAKLARVHDWIAALPDGYQTRVGERGMRLSGGERQRLSLARAFLRDAPILILDEPTSAVDVRTEAEILEALERLIAGRTTILIAHRPSTLERCDLRLTLDRARVTELSSGTPSASPVAAP